jgi:putative FmdB family regulatory protein
MPRYEFFCHACKQLFSKTLSPAEYEEGDVVCPYCGSEEVEQSWSADAAQQWELMLRIAGRARTRTRNRRISLSTIQKR